MAKKPLEIDMIAGSQLRDTQGEMLSVEGADISDLQSGNGRINDNHGKGFFNSIGRVTSACKIFKSEDCNSDRQRYFWEKVKAPFIYVTAVLYDDDDHPNAKAAAAILRNIHKADSPLKLKASVEGGVLARGIGDEQLLARTKIHSVALTFTPANNATLVEPTSLEKSDSNWEQDRLLIKSVMHLAKTDVPSFRHITRRAQAEKISENLRKANEIAEQAGLKGTVPNFTADELITQALEFKITQNIQKINEMIKSVYSGSTKDTMPKTLGAMKLDQDSPEVMRHHQNLHQSFALKATNPESRAFHHKAAGDIYAHLAGKTLDKALTAGYGGAGAPGGRTGGAVLQTETLDDGHRGFKYIRCNSCGKEHVYMKHQVKCRDCGQSYPMADLYTVMVHTK